MKKNYAPEKQTKKTSTLPKLFIFLLFCLMPAILLQAQVLVGSSKCEDATGITIGVQDPDPDLVYQLYRRNIDGSWSKLQKINSDATFAFAPTNTIAGAYWVYSYPSL
ncbi:MAG: hypothetical protein ACOYMF_18725, partial [Bacteroidales bacterium]